jgi:PTH1 family peptidyl-tRNA hydrolase
MGMMMLDMIVEKWGASWNYSSSLKGWVCKHRLESSALGLEIHPWQKDLLLYKPKGFMNDSGKFVKRLMQHHGNLSQLLVVHDDLERKLGKVTIKMGGSANGHNGIRSIISELKESDFKRVRVGIGRPANNEEVANYVLEKFTDDELEVIRTTVHPLFVGNIVKLAGSSS